MRRAVLLLLVLGAITAVSVVIATRLRVLAGFEDLLPDTKKSVQELRRVADRTGGASTVFVVLEGDDSDALRSAGDALVPALLAVGEPWVSQAEDNVRDVQRFIEPRAGLYPPLEDLARLGEDVTARFEYEVSIQVGSDIAMDPEDIPPKIDADLVKKRLHLDDSALGDDRFPDGYYQSADRKTLVVTVRSGVVPSDFDKGSQAIAKIRAAVDGVKPSSFHPSIHWGLTGDLAIGLSEFKAINRDLTEVGLLGAALIASVVFLYYLRLRTLVAMVLTILVGLAWTFGFTELSLGHLNIATGFLFTIIAGNGINVAIIYMARYLEERGAGRSLEEAIAVAHRTTWKPTLTGALAAAGAYGSLSITAFKGFREFGIIGGVGMLLCWIATFATLPAVLAVMERISPLKIAAGTSWFARLRSGASGGVPFGRPFAFLVSRAPRLITIVGAVVAIAGGVALVLYARTNPMEYDLTKVQSDPRATAEEQRLVRLAKAITGYVGLDGMAILVDRLDQVEPLREALNARRDAAPEAEKPFRAVHALQDFVPADQEAKIPILKKLADQMNRAHRKHLIKDEDWTKLERILPPDDLAPFGIEDLPAGLARPFTERDGTRGRVVYISPTTDELTNDAHYLFRWADSFRRTELPDKSVILGSGRAVIYADMWSAVLADIPKAVIASLAATIAAVVLAFRGRRDSLRVLGALAIGVLWTAGALVIAHVKLNFLNFIALPITFGIGVDYAVNIVHREATVGDPLKVLRGTGGAVVLCSLTTLLGYFALVGSMNFAVRSLGITAVIGEVSCLLAAVLVLPASSLGWRKKPVSGPSAVSSKEVS